MKKEKKVWAITLIACWWLPTQIQAQDSLKTKNLEEVVVTASKFPKNKNEIGKVITVITENQISQSKGKDLAQLLNEQVGLVVNGSNSNAGKDKSVYLQGASNAYTLILMDGVPLNDPSGISGGVYDLRLLSLDQIERIEILKGSQSTLYGSNAVAGVINLITKKSSTKPVSGNVSAGYGSYNTFRAATGISGSYGAFDYQAGYGYFKTDGISEAKDQTSAGGFDKDGADQNSITTSLGYKTKNFFIRPYFRQNAFNGKYDAGAFTDDINNRYETKLLNTGFSSQVKLRRSTVDFLYGYNGSDRKFKSSFNNTPTELRYNGKFQAAEIFWNAELKPTIQVLSGVQYQFWKMIDDKAAEKNPTADFISPYVAIHGKWNRKFFIEAGARYNQHSKYGNNMTYSINPSLVLKTNVKFFINHATGFKAPSLTQLFGQYGANPNLKPEKSNSLDGGVEWFSHNARIDARATVFDRQINDVIIYNSSFQYVNFDKQHDHGFEVESGIKVSEKIKTKLFYTYVSGRVTTQTNGVETKSYNLLRRPRNSFGVNLNWTPSPKISVGLNCKTFGKRSDRYFDLSDFQTKEVSLKAYALLDIYGEFKLNKNSSLYLDGKNLLNQKYQEVYGYNTYGFNLMAGIRAQF